MKYKNLSLILLVFFMLVGCQPKPEVYQIKGTQLEGILTVVSKERIEFAGRLQGQPNSRFWLYSQEESIEGNSQNLIAMNCSVSSFDSEGLAYVNCFVDNDKKSRQNAIIFSEKELEVTEKVIYRPNLITSYDEHVSEMDFRYKNLGISPNSVKKAMHIYHALDLEMEINADYNRYPLRGGTLNDTYAYSRGFYLTFITKIDCDGVYTENHVNLYRWDGDSWEFADSVRLENVDFNSNSGIYDFNVEGYTLRLKFSDHYKCHREYESVIIP